MRKTGQFIILKKRDKNKPIKTSLFRFRESQSDFFHHQIFFFLMIDLLDTLIESLARFWLKGNMLININRQHIKYSNRQSIKIRVHIFSLLKNTQIAISISFFHRHSFSQFLCSPIKCSPVAVGSLILICFLVLETVFVMLSSIYDFLSTVSGRDVYFIYTLGSNTQDIKTSKDL